MNESSLPSELRRLRRRTRLSQRGLAARSKIAFTTIQLLEANPTNGDRVIRPQPDTLRQIATGAAYDEETAMVDQRQADAYYELLMRAVGYLDGIATSHTLDREAMQALLSDKALASIGQILELYPSLPPEDQVYVQRTLRSVVGAVTADPRG